jgi:hypothetical protein
MFTMISMSPAAIGGHGHTVTGPSLKLCCWTASVATVTQRLLLEALPQPGQALPGGSWEYRSGKTPARIERIERIVVAEAHFFRGIYYAMVFL